MAHVISDLGHLGSFLGLGFEGEYSSLKADQILPGNTGRTIFVCVDLEAFEFDQKKILEVGFATLDSHNLVGKAPGEGGSAWLEGIKSHHYIVKERRHLVNKRYVKGCPEGFVFGQSQITPILETQALLRRHFSEPRSIPGSAISNGPDDEAPSVYIVAHGLKNDTSLMKNFGIDNIYDTGINGQIDTQKLCSPKKKPASLKRLLDALEIPYEHLHNAANDATYTLQALVKMIFMEKFAPEDLAFRINLVKNPPHDPNKLPKNKRKPKGEGESRGKVTVLTESETSPKQTLGKRKHETDVKNGNKSGEKLQDRT
ncbi:hypothetical protein C1H76_2999 [Elsinoe australis]|uniref:Gfd2/YDR514C-like C-terminal domain-containing protein n=1 Tax=Elsinoe australis TaxID=40998 RepID=A0A4U7B9C8_9PEZI|nr:hypothetical protein C1H76_2999 [Elsinoe australis]